MVHSRDASAWEQENHSLLLGKHACSSECAPPSPWTWMSPPLEECCQSALFAQLRLFKNELRPCLLDPIPRPAQCPPLYSQSLCGCFRSALSKVIFSGFHSELRGPQDPHRIHVCSQQGSCTAQPSKTITSLPFCPVASSPALIKTANNCLLSMVVSGF